MRSHRITTPLALLLACGPAGPDAADAVGDELGNETETQTETGPEACAYTCAVDPIRGISSCTEHITVTSTGAPTMTGVIDMTGFVELEVGLEICDPLGWTFHLADSQSDGFGGDFGSSSNDAELHLTETSLFVYGSEMCSMDLLVHEQPDFVPAAGCSERTLIASDAQLDCPMPAFALEQPCLLRINPASDDEGTPDALWYFGLNRTYVDAMRTGSGLVRASFCLR